MEACEGLLEGTAGEASWCDLQFGKPWYRPPGGLGPVEASWTACDATTPRASSWNAFEARTRAGRWTVATAFPKRKPCGRLPGAPTLLGRRPGRPGEHPWDRILEALGIERLEDVLGGLRNLPAGVRRHREASWNSLGRHMGRLLQGVGRHPGPAGGRRNTQKHGFAMPGNRRMHVWWVPEIRATAVPQWAWRNT